MSDFHNALISETTNAELQDKLKLFGQFVGDWDLDGVYGKGTPNECHIPGGLLGISAMAVMAICTYLKQSRLATK